MDLPGASRPDLARRPSGAPAAAVVTGPGPTAGRGTTAGPAAGAPGGEAGWWRGAATALVGATSNQLGAGVGAGAFGAVGPAGVVAVRQVVAAAVLLPLARPPLRRLTWSQWWPVLLLALVFAGMNLALYTAVDRIGLALAVTLEFLGPLGVALAASRSRRDLLTALVAAAGVYLLVLPGPSSDLVGVAVGVAAGACWAAYIVVNRVVGRRLPGLQGPALASGLSAVGYLPVLVLVTADGRWDAETLLRVLATGLLSSVVPFTADLVALRTVPPRVFGILSSTQPVLAALVGLVLLGQVLAAHEWAGIAVIVVANVVAVTSAPRRSRRRSDGRGPSVDGGDAVSGA
ncbi:EamA family transporter [Pseudokineococcus marinus]|uniref:EamA family transporter n=1 Tax=Pseudokineococcus marinus TaxID=351215 RepID=A0A849BMF9_9ACTN|nr:EamA family transporter [Pseudokineococcus marinus]NNH21982.1 EamA family transporter [Pseudokineococcus marinus]